MVVDIFLLIDWVRASREVEDEGPDLWWVTYSNLVAVVRRNLVPEMIEYILVQPGCVYATLANLFIPWPGC